MIRRFNFKQNLRAIIAFASSIFAYGIAALFVGWVLWLLEGSLKVQSWWWPVGVFGFWCAMTWSGWQRWKAGLGHYGADESLGYLNLDESNAGAWEVQNKAASLTGCAYVLSQIFLAGPLQALKAGYLLRSRLPTDALTEQRLMELLERVRAKGSWHGIENWVGSENDISALIRLGLVEFSSTKGRIRAKP
jgi:hypothetical protein